MSGEGREKEKRRGSKKMGSYAHAIECTAGVRCATSQAPLGLECAGRQHLSSEFDRADRRRRYCVHRNSSGSGSVIHAIVTHPLIGEREAVVPTSAVVPRQIKETISMRGSIVVLALAVTPLVARVSRAQDDRRDDRREMRAASHDHDRDDDSKCKERNRGNPS